MPTGRLKKLPITPEIQAALQTDASEMYRVEKLFLGDGEPVVFGINYFSTEFINDELLSCPMDETLIFTLIQERFEFPDIAYDILNIRPYAADAYIAAQLQIPEHTAMLMFESVSMARDEQPLLVNHEFYHPEKIHFREVRLRRLSHERYGKLNRPFPNRHLRHRVPFLYPEGGLYTRG